MARTLIFLASWTVLSGCQAPAHDPERLADACQLKPCSCVDEDAGAFFDPETKPLLWRDTGEAYCPEGFRLQLEGAE